MISESLLHRGKGAVGEKNWKQPRLEGWRQSRKHGAQERSSLPLQGVVKAAPPFLCPSSVVPNCQRRCAGGLALPSPFSDEETGSERLTPAKALKDSAEWG